MTARVLAFRFDIDSVRCAEEGVPRLMRLADRAAVRFTFFVNMGLSFNWAHNLRHLARKRLAAPAAQTGDAHRALPTTRKLGWRGVLKTVFVNPELGERYRPVLDALSREGHELGLHGGMDHVIWQRGLAALTDEGLERLFSPAYRRFEDRYGAPRGFASPGFVHDDRVLDLLDRYGFAYGSDRSGNEPFRPQKANGDLWEHFQVPVNVAAPGNVPIIEEGLARGLEDREIVRRCVDAIRAHSFALLYGHPYVEGVHVTLLEELLRALGGEYDVTTVADYLERWRAERHG
jgi:peptidoglycan/xylan/chitin deacetylase (PgdA/CDA1 family)